MQHYQVHFMRQRMRCMRRKPAVLQQLDNIDALLNFVAISLGINMTLAVAN
jgi:hypothetical protein